MDRITCEIKEHIGVIDQRNGWTKELNVVAWGGGVPKYDIREWNEDHTKMSKGATLTEEQACALYKLLERRFK